MSADIKPSMMLVTAELKSGNSFRLIPMIKDCPFSEGIFDMKSKVLTMLSKETKDSLHMIHRIDGYGDPMLTKRPRPHGQQFQEERVKLETFSEYYVSIPGEIDALIKTIAINADTFDYMKYINGEVIPEFHLGDIPRTEETGENSKEKPPKKGKKASSK